MPFSSYSPAMPVLIGMLFGCILFALILCWLFQRKSAAQPVRNGIISAAIPTILLSLVGSIQISPILLSGGGDGPTSVFVTINSAISGIILFALILLPSSILLCKKLAKKHSAKENQV